MLYKLSDPWKSVIDIQTYLILEGVWNPVASWEHVASSLVISIKLWPDTAITMITRWSSECFAKHSISFVVHFTCFMSGYFSPSTTCLDYKPWWYLYCAYRISCELHINTAPPPSTPPPPKSPLSMLSRFQFQTR